MIIDDNVLNDERKYCCYMHTNKINGKRYIGITCQDPKARWGSTGNGYIGQPFYNAIEKYGWDNFDHEIIADGLSKAEAMILEGKKIEEYKTYMHENGYNVNHGGQGSGCNGESVLQFTMDGHFVKEYLNCHVAARECGFQITSFSIGGCCRGTMAYAKDHIWKYKKDINDIKIFENQIREEYEKTHRHILQYSLDGKFMKEWTLDELKNENQSTVVRQIKNMCKQFDSMDINDIKNFSVHNYLWFYKDQINKLDEIMNLISIRKKREMIKYKHIYLYSLQGKLIYTFPGINALAKEFNSIPEEIEDAYKNNNRFFKGFIVVDNDDIYDFDEWYKTFDQTNNLISDEDLINYHRIYQFNKFKNIMGVYRSINEAVIKHPKIDNINWNIYDLLDACKSGRELYGSYWSFVFYNPSIIPVERSRKLDWDHAVLEFDNLGNFIKYHEVIKYAAQELNITRNKITKSCTGRSFIDKDSFWRYAIDFDSELIQQIKKGW